MLDNLAKQFLDSPTVENGIKILEYTRSNNIFNIGVTIGEFLSNMYPTSIKLNEEYAINAYYGNYHEKAYDIFEKLLQLKGIDEETSFRLLFNQHFSMNQIADRYIGYDKDKVNNILNREKRKIPLVTLSITTCKRFDLFEKTINSIINCFDTDMIDTWLCVDDNSSDEDREKMKNMYPFFIFIFKDESLKGHPKSMNIIKQIVKTPYLLHLEDDWKFIVKRNYIKDALEVLNSDNKIGQCLINRNYSEIESDIGIKGGIFKTTDSGFRYYIHEFASTNEEILNWTKRHGGGLSSNYWPHFSLRPSLFRTSIFSEVGDFNENVGHFEMEYAYRYFSKGYISVFFEGIYTIHIGRLTSEKHDDSKINAYKLNNEQQFVKKPLTPILEELDSEIELSELGINIKTYVLNLDRRPDRWENFVKKAQPIEFLNYERFSAIDGSKLKSTTQLQRIFDGNDYNMQVGAVGCAMSYFKMLTELINSEYDAFLFLEDDIEISKDFDIKFFSLCKQLKNEEWDVMFIGHHIRNVADKSYKENKIPTIEKWDVYTSFQNSLGGTIGFMVSKNGASRFLDFVNRNRLINCIDTALQKSANELDVYYCTPHLVFSECYTNNRNVDTDIQNNFSSLSITLDEKINNELEFYKERDLMIEELDFENTILKLDSEDEFIIYCKDNIDKIRTVCKQKNIKYYTYDEKVIFIINLSQDIDRYFHIFKTKDIYSVDDCFVI